MTNEAVLKLKLEEPWDWIVHDATAVEKGTIMKISGVGIAAANTGDGDIFAGIARREKITGDGRTRLALFRRGIVDVVCGGAVTQGEWVATSGVNTVRKATTGDLLSGKGIGIMRETVSATGTGECILGGY